MEALNNGYRLIESYIKQNPFNGNPQSLYEPINYLLGIGGKRIRPLLTICAYEMYRKDTNVVLPVAMSLEVFHNFTLMHDDIMDKAPLRRGQVTVHEKWNTNTAILSGDSMLIKAYELLSLAPDHAISELLRLFNATALGICEGQQMDMEFETRTDVSVREYLKMIELKTAILLGCSLQFGAITAGATAEDKTLLYDFGVNAGMAFQIMDDLLDAFGSPEHTGKQPGGDILSNKKTWLYLKSLELLPENDRMQLAYLYLQNAEYPGKTENVITLFNKAEIQSKATALMNSYFEKAYQCLQKVSVPNDKKEPLRHLTEMLRVRIS